MPALGHREAAVTKQSWEFSWGWAGHGQDGGNQDSQQEIWEWGSVSCPQRMEGWREFRNGGNPGMGQCELFSAGWRDGENPGMEGIQG